MMSILITDDHAVLRATLLDDEHGGGE